ncbi:Non-structural maintenance of chromosome0s element 1 [Vanrija pseudolonga]|uniref:Non-structural maintenance of chromosomes element 1 homolog n=1 Tax=Vanrija pseudolonga TaxID=143232 RepID=A0AAF0Y6X8_9TREE|nr:Non-structural maintenance of chromosome0s element 1 [Vanrija pseudolonga]
MAGRGGPAPTDLHRVYIQSLLSRRAMTEDVALEMYKRAIGAVIMHDRDFRPTHRANKEGLTAFLAEVSALLEAVDMVVKRARDESPQGRWWIVLCNTAPDAVGTHATDLTPLEVSFFRLVVKAIVQSYPHNSIGSGAAVRLVRELQSATISNSQAQELLGALTSRGWLAKSKRNRYSIATRGMLELDAYLKSEAEFEDYIQTCAVCEKVILTGMVCGNDDCEAHYHEYCYNQLNRGDRGACRSCQKPFARYPPSYVGEKGVSRVEDDFVNTGRRKKRPPRRSANGNGHRHEEDDGEEDELESEEDDVGIESRAVRDESEEPTQTQGRSQRRRREAESEDEGEPQRRSQRRSRVPETQAEGAAETIIPDSIGAEDDEDEEDSQPVRRPRRR